MTSRRGWRVAPFGNRGREEGDGISNWFIGETGSKACSRSISSFVRAGPCFVHAGTVMHAYIIDCRDECRRRVLAAQIKASPVAGLDLVLNDLTGNANALTSLGMVSPEFDVGYGDWGWCKILTTPLHAILADAGAGLKLNRYFWVLRGQRHCHQ